MPMGGKKITRKSWHPPPREPEPGPPPVSVVNIPRRQPGEGSRVFGYVRVSSAGQADNTSMESQRSEIRAYYDFLLREKGALMPFVEDVVSGTELFKDRPAGGHLFLEARGGDHIVFAKMDRGFRNVRDMCNTVGEWMDRGVVIHFCEMKVATDTPIGRFLMNMLAYFAEFERVRIAERMREGRERRKAEGRPTQGRPPWGFRIAGQRGNRYLVRDDAERDLGARIVEMVDGQGMQIKQAYLALRAEGVKSDRAKNKNKNLTEMVVWLIYHRERKLRDQERYAAIGEELVPVHVKNGVKKQ